MPCPVGRKFLLAGKGGMNLTHSESLDRFMQRYGEREPQLAPLLQAFGPDQVRAWAQGLGIETFVGTSGRVFPVDMKAAPLLRAWLHRLRGLGVHFQYAPPLAGLGWAGPLVLCFTPGRRGAQFAYRGAGPGGGELVASGVRRYGYPTAYRWRKTLRPANCGGFDVQSPAAPAQASGWSPHFVQAYAGQPFKSVALNFVDHQGRRFARKGVCGHLLGR